MRMQHSENEVGSARRGPFVRKFRTFTPHFLTLVAVLASACSSVPVDPKKPIENGFFSYTQDGKRITRDDMKAELLRNDQARHYVHESERFELYSVLSVIPGTTILVWQLGRAISPYESSDSTLAWVGITLFAVGVAFDGLADERLNEAIHSHNSAVRASTSSTTLLRNAKPYLVSRRDGSTVVGFQLAF